MAGEKLTIRAPVARGCEAAGWERPPEASAPTHRNIATIRLDPLKAFLRSGARRAARW